MAHSATYRLKQYIIGWTHSFAWQLLVLHVRNRIFFLLPWVLIFLWSSKLLHWDYGIPFLFLIPEYLGKENVVSYILVGFSIGVFIMVWHITSYLLESHKFPFMANLRHPFAMFCLNNSLIPGLFVLTYLASLLHYEWRYGTENYLLSFFNFGGFLLGVSFAVMLIATYFLTTNLNIYKFIDHAIASGKNIIQNGKLGYNLEAQNKWHVETYLSLKGKTRLTRTVKRYDLKLVSQVFRQHHFNFFIAQVAFITLLVMLGFLVEIPAFQIPAACSLVLALTLLTSVFGLFKFWTGQWSTALFILVFLLINYAYKFGLSMHENKAYGLNYDQQINYSQSTFDSMTSIANVAADIENTKLILDKWKEKNSIGRPLHYKPKMVIVMASGGGLSSALFTSRVVQLCNQYLNNTLFSKTSLLTGASGGIIGLSYMRELQFNQVTYGDINQEKYARAIAKDLLNPMCVTNLTHDIFYPLRTFTYANQVYKKDRTYLFEWKLNENAHGLFNKQIREYALPESKGEIPLLFHNATLVNDYKQLIISAQPVRYMMKPLKRESGGDHVETDMLDFCSFFKNNGGNLLQLSTAVRINATYPLILPAVNLPTTPEISAIDGGMRDNNGAQIVFRFMDVFKEWINENTSGVVVIQIKYFSKFKTPKKADKLSLLEKVTNPIGTIYSNIFELQDYEQDQLFNAANNFLGGKLKVVRFEYNDGMREKEGSLSFHLTEQEKRNIIECAQNKHNAKGYAELKQLFNE